MPTHDLTTLLARFAAGLAFDDLPPGVVTFAKQLTLDSLGTALAATTLGSGCQEVIAAMERLGDRGKSTIVGRSAKVSAPNAAFANGALVHALNYDAFGKTAGHTGVACFAAPLAMAQARAPISGKTFLTAVVAAAEINARITLVKGSAHLSHRILAGQFFSYLGAAAGAGRIIGLDASAMHSAFGLAVMQVAGTRQVVIGGDVPAKAIYAAFPNQAGVLAALLAEAGLRADYDALEGESGFYGFAADGHFDAAAIAASLGTRFDFTSADFKLWPVSIHVAPFIRAALELAERDDLDPANIRAVEIAGPRLIADWFEPLAERRHPSNPVAAADSAIFGTAKALAHRNVVLADFTPAGLADAAYRAVAERVTYRLDDEIAGGVVEVTLTDGRKLSVSAAEERGHGSGPAAHARIVAKFRDCCSYVPGLAQAQVDALVDFVDRLEDAPSVSPLAELTSPAPAA
jgi:2-methylcitrate dehydratase PrpD